MTREESNLIILDTFDKVKVADDEIIKTVKRLKIVLLNLKIQDAHIKENTGIIPIADELNKNIIHIEECLEDLINNNRTRLTEALKVLKSENE